MIFHHLAALAAATALGAAAAQPLISEWSTDVVGVSSIHGRWDWTVTSLGGEACVDSKHILAYDALVTREFELVASGSAGSGTQLVAHDPQLNEYVCLTLYASSGFYLYEETNVRSSSIADVFMACGPGAGGQQLVGSGSVRQPGTEGSTACKNFTSAAAGGPGTAFAGNVYDLTFGNVWGKACAAANEFMVYNPVSITKFSFTSAEASLSSDGNLDYDGFYGVARVTQTKTDNSDLRELYHTCIQVADDRERVQFFEVTGTRNATGPGGVQEACDAVIQNLKNGNVEHTSTTSILVTLPKTTGETCTPETFTAGSVAWEKGTAALGDLVGLYAQANLPQVALCIDNDFQTKVDAFGATTFAITRSARSGSVGVTVREDGNKNAECVVYIKNTDGSMSQVVASRLSQGVGKAYEACEDALTTYQPDTEDATHLAQVSADCGQAIPGEDEGAGAVWTYFNQALTSGKAYPSGSMCVAGSILSFIGSNGKRSDVSVVSSVNSASVGGTDGSALVGLVMSSTSDADGFLEQGEAAWVCIFAEDAGDGFLYHLELNLPANEVYGWRAKVMCEAVLEDESILTADSVALSDPPQDGLTCTASSQQTGFGAVSGIAGLHDFESEGEGNGTVCLFNGTQQLRSEKGIYSPAAQVTASALVTDANAALLLFTNDEGEHGCQVLFFDAQDSQDEGSVYRLTAAVSGLSAVEQTCELAALEGKGSANLELIGHFSFRGDTTDCVRDLADFDIVFDDELMSVGRPGLFSYTSGGPQPVDDQSATTEKFCKGTQYYSFEHESDKRGFWISSGALTSTGGGILVLQANKRAQDGYSVDPAFRCIIIEPLNGAQSVQTIYYDEDQHDFATIEGAKDSCKQLLQMSEVMQPWAEVTIEEETCGPIMQSIYNTDGNVTFSLQGLYTASSTRFAAACVGESEVAFLGRPEQGAGGVSGYLSIFAPYEPNVTLAVIELPKENIDDAKEFGCVAFRQQPSGTVFMVQVMAAFATFEEANTACSSASYMGFSDDAKLLATLIPSTSSSCEALVPIDWAVGTNSTSGFDAVYALTAPDDGYAVCVGWDNSISTLALGSSESVDVMYSGTKDGSSSAYFITLRAAENWWETDYYFCQIFDEGQDDESNPVVNWLQLTTPAFTLSSALSQCEALAASEDYSQMVTVKAMTPLDNRATCPDTTGNSPSFMYGSSMAYGAGSAASNETDAAHWCTLSTDAVALGVEGTQAYGSLVAAINGFPTSGGLLRVTEVGDGSLGTETYACLVMSSDSYFSLGFKVEAFPIDTPGDDYLLPEAVAKCSAIMANQDGFVSASESTVLFELATDASCPDLGTLSWQDGMQGAHADFGGLLALGSGEELCIESDRSSMRSSYSGIELLHNLTSSAVADKNATLITYQTEYGQFRCRVMIGDANAGMVHTVMPSSRLDRSADIMRARCELELMNDRLPTGMSYSLTHSDSCYIAPVSEPWVNDDDLLASYWGTYTWATPFGRSASPTMCLSDGFLARELSSKPLERVVVSTRQLGASNRIAFIYGAFRDNGNSVTSFYFCSPTIFTTNEQDQTVATMHFIAATLGYTVAASQTACNEYLDTFDMTQSGVTATLTNDADCGPAAALQSADTAEYLPDGFTGPFIQDTTAMCIANGTFSIIDGPTAEVIDSWSIVWTAQTIDDSLALAVLHTETEEGATEFICLVIEEGAMEGSFTTYELGIRSTKAEAVAGCDSAAALQRTGGESLQATGDDSCEESFTSPFVRGAAVALQSADGTYGAVYGGYGTLCVNSTASMLTSVGLQDLVDYTIEFSSTTLASNGQLFAVAKHQDSGAFSYTCLVLAMDSNGHIIAMEITGSEFDSNFLAFITCSRYAEDGDATVTGTGFTQLPASAECPTEVATDDLFFSATGTGRFSSGAFAVDGTDGSFCNVGGYMTVRSDDGDAAAGQIAGAAILANEDMYLVYVTEAGDGSLGSSPWACVKANSTSVKTYQIDGLNFGRADIAAARIACGAIATDTSAQPVTDFAVTRNDQAVCGHRRPGDWHFGLEGAPSMDGASFTLSGAIAEDGATRACFYNDSMQVPSSTDIPTMFTVLDSAVYNNTGETLILAVDDADRFACIIVRQPDEAGNREIVVQDDFAAFNTLDARLKCEASANYAAEIPFQSTMTALQGPIEDCLAPTPEWMQSLATFRGHEGQYQYTSSPDGRSAALITEAFIDLDVDSDYQGFEVREAVTLPGHSGAVARVALTLGDEQSGNVTLHSCVGLTGELDTATLRFNMSQYRLEDAIASMEEDGVHEACEALAFAMGAQDPHASLKAQASPTPSPMPSTSSSPSPSMSPEAAQASASPSASAEAVASASPSTEAVPSASPSTEAVASATPTSSPAAALASPSPSSIPPMDPCVPNPCKNGATCASSRMGDDATFTCECASDDFTGDLCQTVVLQGPCVDEPCGNGVCSDSATTSSGFVCSCNTGWLRDDATGSCTEAIPEDAEPSCFDGEQNGDESDVDCGFEEEGVCGLCVQGLACESTANCDGDLVCSQDTNTCTPAVRSAGAYVAANGVKLQGVNKKQFLDALAEPYKAKLVERTGAEEATITRVAEQAGGSGRRLQAGSVEVDTSLRFAASTDTAAAAASVTSYVQGAPEQGGNGLLEDLQAAAPALASQLQVDTSSLQTETEVLDQDETVTEAVPEPTTPVEGDDDDDSLGAGAIIGGAVGGVVLLAIIGTLVYMVARKSARPATDGQTKDAADKQQEFSDIGATGGKFKGDNPMRSERV